MSKHKEKLARGYYAGRVGGGRQKENPGAQAFSLSKNLLRSREGVENSGRGRKTGGSQIRERNGKRLE